MKENKTNNTIQTFWVMIGSLSAFVFTILSSMILSRYFNKHDYGTYKQVIYVYNTLLIVFTLGIPKAYSFFLPRYDKEEGKSVLNKLNFVLALNGILFSLVIYIFSSNIGEYLENESLGALLKVFSVVPFLMLPTMGLDGVMSTYKKVKFLALYNILSKVFMFLCIVVPVVYYNGGVDYAVFGFVAASFINFLLAIYLKYLPLKKYRKKKSNLSYSVIFKYTLPIMGASIWGILIRSSDQFFISKYFGSEEFAVFSNGYIELPFISMIISATSVVLYPIFSKKIHEGDSNFEIINLWHSVFKKSAMLIYPILIFFICFADLIVVLMYGEGYVGSSKYFQLKLLTGFFNLIAFGPLVLSIGGEKYYYNVHMFSAIVLIVVDFIFVTLFKEPLLVAVVSTLSQIIRAILILLFISKFFKIKLIDLFPMRLLFDLSLPGFLMLYLTRYFMSFFDFNDYYVILLSLLIYLIFCFFWFKYRKINYIELLLPLLRKYKV